MTEQNRQANREANAKAEFEATEAYWTKRDAEEAADAALLAKMTAPPVEGEPVAAEA